jgi:hypothetical protein
LGTNYPRKDGGIPVLREIMTEGDMRITNCLQEVFVVGREIHFVVDFGSVYGISNVIQGAY